MAKGDAGGGNVQSAQMPPKQDQYSVMHMIADKLGQTGLGPSNGFTPPPIPNSGAMGNNSLPTMMNGILGGQPAMGQAMPRNIGGGGRMGGPMRPSMPQIGMNQ